MTGLTTSAAALATTISATSMTGDPGHDDGPHNNGGGQRGMDRGERSIERWSSVVGGGQRGTDRGEPVVGRTEGVDRG